MRPVFGDWQAANGPAVTMAYVVTASCGHVRAVIVDEGSGSAQEAAGFALQGMTVDRRPMREALRNGGCSICMPDMSGLFAL